MAKSCRRVTGLPLADLTGESLGLEVTGKLKKNSQRKKIHTISPTEQVPEKWLIQTWQNNQFKAQLA